MDGGYLHVANGDSTAGTLRDADVPGRVVNWADALTDGPVPDVDHAELRRVRARFWSDKGFVSFADAASMHEAWDRDLQSFTDDDEVVVWCEHDLYDQLLLLHHLDTFAGRRPRAFSLICIDRFPGVSRFIGLGQLRASELASLFPARERLTDAHVALGRAGWSAFVGDDPRAIERFLAADLSPLPFMAAALGQLLQEYPSARDGLPRTERRLLEIIAAGDSSFGSLFAAWQASEATPCYGDSSIWWRLRDLAGGPRPLVAMGDPSSVPRREAAISITDDGRRVLAGQLGWLTICPFDRWIGGVHLTSANAWRWDAERQRLVRPPG